jgi:Zn-dependent metalloprotease
MTHTTLKLSLLTVALSAAFAVQAQDKAALTAQRDTAMARLSADSGTTPQISMHSATGTARFVRAAPGGKIALQRSALAMNEAGKQGASAQWLANYGGLFGISSPAAELSAARVASDVYGGTHLSYRQVYKGVPVFGGEVKSHFDPAGHLSVVNGTFVPGIAVDPKPTQGAEVAMAAALARVKDDLGVARLIKSAKLSASKPTLMIYRDGLAKGVEGNNYLAWQVEVGNRVDVRDFVYVDAHTGKVIDKIAGIHEAKNRRAFDAMNLTAPGPNYPNNPFWVEGQAFPTGNVEADNMIAASSEVYDLFKTAFGRDSYDGAGATMDSVFNRGNACPNASWNGTLISFCPGTTTDDITAHEWAHAYTEYTHGLIYAWQSGALNEAYSDIWGETVDRINGRGTDTPDAARTAGSCTAFTAQPPTVNITAPAAIAGPKSAGAAAFGATNFSISGTVAGVQVGSTTAACAALPASSLAGKIAFIDRGGCGFSLKAQFAEQAGAIAVIIGNNVAGGAPSLGATAGTVNTVPTLSVSQADGTAIKAQLASTTVTASLQRGGNGSDNSVRWLLGEDSTAFSGAIRDMYNPTCYGNPGKVSDAQYSCGPNTQAGDNGGVHTNSGVPNHAYALLVDGGDYNGQTIAGIGLTKAAHIYYRAQSVYQGPASNFTDHADALSQSCADLTGLPLAALKTGAPAGEVITASDCAQVVKAATAVELRSTVSQCNFAPILAQNPPPLCAAGTASTIVSDGFDGGKKGGIKWQISYVGTSAFTPRNWGVVNGLPGGRPGYAIFANDLNNTSCDPSQAGLQRLESAEITVPASTTTLRMAFDHYVATEAGYDGGNLKISVNGGAYQVVSAANFVFNPYNVTMATAAAGNDSPLAGQPGFSGTDAGSNAGSWGRSIVNLAPYAVAGDKVKLRFELGNDACGGVKGWFIDDVNVYRCVAAP